MRRKEKLRKIVKEINAEVSEIEKNWKKIKKIVGEKNRPGSIGIRLPTHPQFVVIFYVYYYLYDIRFYKMNDSL